MTSENNMGNTSTGIKKLVLSLPPRVRVDTTQGTYFARHMSIGDLKSFGEYFDEKREKTSTDLRALGERLLKVLVCFSEEGEKPQH